MANSDNSLHLALGSCYWRVFFFKRVLFYILTFVLIKATLIAAHLTFPVANESKSAPCYKGFSAIYSNYLPFYNVNLQYKQVLISNSAMPI